jgi:lysophospholipase L1-like esterase
MLVVAVLGQMLLLAHAAEMQSDPGVPPGATASAPVNLFIAGDSTAANGAPGAIGWGKHLQTFFEPSKLRVDNLARGGRSSRTFIAEGLWDRLLEGVKAGDLVLIQFGHNDGGPINDERRARGSLPGLGDESQEIENLLTKQHEVVHAFGWYLRKMIADTKAKGATPILLSLTVRDIWKEGRVERGSGRYGEWTRAVATSQRVPFVDLTALIADRYERMGEEAVKGLFPRDHTHTSDEGAKLNAELVVTGLKGLRDQSLVRCLSALGRTARTAPPANVVVGERRRPAPAGGPGTNPADFQRWLNLPEPGDPSLPSLFLIGDSTVRTGRGDGGNGQFGWGDPLDQSFDPAKINVVNRAVGGTGAGTFIAQGHWERVLALLKAGDVVIMQFGHNDNGSRGALRGTGEETLQRENPATKQTGTVHTFGWYLRKYIAETRARGATPIVCSLIPRNIWREGRIARTKDGHADWAHAVAESEKTAFIDLHEIIARRYDTLGPDAVAPLFADARVHTSWSGAVLNAECVLAGLRDLPENPLKPYMLATENPAPDRPQR